MVTIAELTATGANKSPERKRRRSHVKLSGLSSNYSNTKKGNEDLEIPEPQLAPISEVTTVSPNELTPKEPDGNAKLLMEIESLKSKLKSLESGSPQKITANENKVLAAIRSEILIQDTSNPQIGRNKLLKKYGINARYLDESILGLETKGLIRRTAVNYSPKIKTFKWEVLDKDVHN